MIGERPPSRARPNLSLRCGERSAEGRVRGACPSSHPSAGTRRRGTASFAAVLALAACASTPPPPPTAPGRPGDDGERLARWLSAMHETAPEPTGPLRLREQRFPAAKGDIRDVYRKVAPTVVLIRSGGGFGTGAVINSAGYVLTNHHVIARAEAVDFKLRVEVERGHLSAQGVMEPEGKPMRAWVLKSDPLIDLAVLRLDAPPADLKALKIAARDPVPGEPVSAVGNGSIGLLWAIKDGEISGIGKLSTHLARLAGGECHVADDPVAAERCRAAASSAELERRLLEAQVPGLVIQTSCTISPGDSGGPLVNRAGELVGVNAFLRSDPRAPVTSNFHVHVAEVRRFLKEVPAEPVSRAPSPWDNAPGAGAWADADGDGKDDLLVVGYPGRAAVFADLLQSSPHADAWVPLAARAKVDADLALAKVSGRATAWYDVDGDGVFDRLVVDGEAGQPARAWRLGKGNAVLGFTGAAKLVDADAFPEGERRTRLLAVQSQLVAATGVGVDDSALSALPDPFASVLPGARLLDADRDGKLDTVSAISALGPVYFFDPAQASFPELTGAGLTDALKRRTLKASVAVVQRGARRWYFVGGEGRFTQALASADSRAELVSDAWTLDPKGRPGEAQPLWFGRDAAHAVTGSFTGAEQGRLRTALGTLLLARPRTTLTPGGFPHPVLDVGADVRAEDSGVADYQWAAVSVVGTRTQASAVVLELDKAALKGVSAAQREEATRKGAIGTDFSWTSRGGFEWYQYDTDHDGTVDAVIIRQGPRTEARRIADGVVTDAPELAKGPPVRPSLFPDKERADALRALAAVFFDPPVVER